MLRLIKACNLQPYMALCVVWTFPAGIFSSFSFHVYTSQKLEKEDIIRFGITGKSFIRAAWLAESSQKPQGSLLEKLTHVRQLAWAHRSQRDGYWLQLQKKPSLDLSRKELICVFLSSFLMLSHSLPLVYKLALEASNPTIVLESFGFAVEYLRASCPWQYLSSDRGMSESCALSKVTCKQSEPGSYI